MGRVRALSTTNTPRNSPQRLPAAGIKVGPLGHTGGAVNLARAARKLGAGTGQHAPAALAVAGRRWLDNPHGRAGGTAWHAPAYRRLAAANATLFGRLPMAIAGGVSAAL